MLKKLLTILSGVLLLALPAAATTDVSGYPIGFCNGEMNPRAGIKFSGKLSSISVAIHIPASYAATVADNRIEAVSFALASKLNLKSVEVWIRESLDGDNLAAVSLEKADLKQGWNSIRFDSPYQIPSATENGFYIGYTYLQTNKAGAISSLDTPHEGALWTRQDDGDWTDMSASGTLCIEGLVYGDNLPKRNISFLSASTDPYFIVSEGTLECVAKVRNLATIDVSSFDIEAYIDGVESPCKATVECSLPLGETGAYRFTISPAIDSGTPASRDVSFRVVAVNGMADEDMTDNSASTSFEVLERAFRRVVLAEEFTTEQCPNCPAVGKYIHDILQQPEFSSSLEVVCHHEGYHNDWLTTDFDAAYCWFYNSNGTYAPATMLDRKRFEDTYSPVFFPKSQEMLEDEIRDRMLMPAMVSVVPTAYISDDSSTISVHVDGERIRDDISADDVITVYVIEDGIKSMGQSGVGGEYTHDHVNRAVNATWGVPVVWNGNTYGYDCEFELNSGWNLANLKIVAFVSHFDPTDPNNCEVANAGVCDIRTSAVEQFPAGTPGHIVKTYSASGIATEGLQPGLNIVVYDDGTVRKTIKR